MPTISVILPFYNAQKYLEIAIQSLLEQTFPDFELICIDDGSQDQSADIVERIASQDRRVVFIQNNKNRGISYSLNLGISIAQGRFVARMDADDIALPNRLETQRLFLEQNPNIQLIGSTALGLNDKGKRLLQPGYLPTQPQSVKFTSLFTAPFIHSSILGRSELFREFYYSEKAEHHKLEDYELWQRMLFAGVNATNLTTPLIAYRIHGNSVTSSKRMNPHSRDNLFCQRSLREKLSLDWEIERIIAVRGKTAYPLNEVRNMLQECSAAFFQKYPCSPLEKKEIQHFQTRILSEVAFKNLRSRHIGQMAKGLQFLLTSGQSRGYFYSRCYNFLSNFMSS